MHNALVSFVLPGGMTIGGSHLWSIQVGRRLADRGWRVCLLAHIPDDLRAILDIEMPKGVEVRCVGKEPLQAMSRRQLKRAAIDYVRGDPDILVPNHSMKAYGICGYVARQRPIHILGVCHTDMEGVYQEARAYEPLITNWVAVSPVIEERLKSLLPGRAADIHMRPCAVDLPADISRTYSGQDEPLRILYAGRIVNHQKNASALRPLVKLLYEQSVNFHFDIVGDGPYRPWLEHELSSLPAEARSCVHLHGAQTPEYVRAMWQKTDICLQMSSFEGTSLSMLEAMGNGAVPVVTDVSGVRDYVTHGVNGFIYSVGDHSTAVTHIAKLADDRGALPRMGSAARNRVWPEVTYEMYLDWFEPLLLSTLERPKRSWSRWSRIPLR